MSKGSMLIKDIEDEELKIIEEIRQSDSYNGVPISWINKYNSKTIDDFALDDSIIERIKQIVKGDMPNLIINGPTGTGKTASLFYIAKTLLGNRYKNNSLIINSYDDDSGRESIDKMDSFCKKKVFNGDMDYSFDKIIILDDFNSVSDAVQYNIKELIDKYPRIRIAITCDSTNLIIDTLQSRCSIIHFPSITKELVYRKIKKICDNEKIKYDGGGIEAIVYTSGGDMRNAINTLHTIYYGFGIVTSDNVYKISGKPDPEIIKEIIDNCKVKNISNTMKLLTDLKNGGYSEYDIVGGLYNYVSTYDKNDFAIKILEILCNDLNGDIFGLISLILLLE